MGPTNKAKLVAAVGFKKGEPNKEAPTNIVFKDGKDLFINLLNDEREHESVLDSLLRQLREEGKLAFPPLLASYLTMSPEMEDILQLWSKTRESSKEQVTIIDRLIIEILETAVSQLTSRMDLGEAEGGEAFRLASPIPLARAIIHRHFAILRFYLSSPSNWIYPPVLSLLTSINRVAPNITKETLALMNIPEPTLNKILAYTPTPASEEAMEDDLNLTRYQELRSCYLEFCATFLETTDLTTRTSFLSQGILGRLNKGLHLDTHPTLRRYLELVTLLAQPEAKLSWGSLLSLIDLSLLAKCVALLKAAPKGSSVGDMVYEFLLGVCTRPGTGICFRDGGWYPRERRGEDRRPVNGVLLSFLMTLRPTESKQYQTLVLGILEASPALASIYWATCQLSLDPRLSSRWLSNMTLLLRTIQLPVPSLVSPHGAHVAPSLATVVDAILPQAYDRATQAKCLQSQVQLVRYFGGLVLLAAFTKLDAVLEAFEAHLQTNFFGATAVHAPAWRTLVNEVKFETKRRLCDFRSVVALHKAASQEDLLMRQVTLRLLQAYQRHMPDLVLQSGVGLDKLIPAKLHDCHPATQAPALELLLHLPDLKWWGSTHGPSPAVSLLQVYVRGAHPSLQGLACRGLHQFLGPSLLFQHDPAELSVWINAFSQFLPASPGLGALLDRALSLAMTSPYKFIDATLALPSPTLRWFPKEQAAEPRSLPFSPLLLALRDMIFLEKDELAAAFVLLARLISDLAVYASSPGFVYAFIQACEAHLGSFSSDLVAPLVSARCHVGALLGILEPSPVDLPSGTLAEEVKSWEECHVLGKLDKALEPAVVPPADELLAMLELGVRYPNLLPALQRKLTKLLTSPGWGALVLSQPLLWLLESKGLDLTPLLLHLPPNLLAASVHLSAIGHPQVHSLMMRSAALGDQGHRFLALAILSKLQLGVLGHQVDVEGAFVLLEAIVAAKPDTLSAIINHPLMTHAFLHEQPPVGSAFLRRLNFSLSHLLTGLRVEVRAQVPSSFINKIVAAVQELIRLIPTEGLDSVAWQVPILLELISILPSDSVEALASLCLGDAKLAFSNLQLAQLTQTLLTALAASPEGAATSGKLVASHLEILLEAWLLRPTLLLDNALVQALSLLVPHAHLLVEFRADLGNAPATLANGCLSGPCMEKFLSALFGAEAYVTLSPERVKISTHLLVAKKSLRSHFCRLVLTSPELLCGSLKHPHLSSGMISLMATFMSVHQLAPSPESQVVARLMAAAVAPAVVEATLTSLTGPTDVLKITLANLGPDGWDVFAGLVSNHEFLTSRLAEVLCLGLAANFNAVLVRASHQLVMKLDTVPRPLCYCLAKLLATLAQNEEGTSNLEGVALITAQAALRFKDADALEQLGHVFGRVTIDAERATTLVAALLAALRAIEADQAPKFRAAGIQILYGVFQSVPHVVGCASNMEALVEIYGARYTREDRLLLEMLVHIEASGGGSIRRAGLLWGGYRARFSSWEVQDLMFKGAIVQESILTLDPATMRETVAHMPLPGLTLDPTVPLVDPPGFQGNGACYDPAFLLPLFKQWLAFGFLDMIQFVRGQNLGLLLACLSSPDVTLRGAAYSLLDEVYLQVETGRFVERQQLLILLQVVKNVVEDRSKGPPPLPSALTQFAAAAAPLVIDPAHPLYNRVSYFLVEQPFLSLRLLPMFVNCFTSFAKGSGAERVWLLKVLCKGLKLPKDFPLYVRCHAFTTLMSYYPTPPPDVKEAEDHQLPILEILFQTAVQPQSAAALLGDFGGLEFLHGVAGAKTWALGPPLALRLAYHLILRSDMRLLSWKLPAWPQSLLVLTLRALDDPVHGVAVAEAALRISSFVTYVGLSHPTIDLGPLKPLMGTILAKACFVLASHESRVKACRPASSGDCQPSCGHLAYKGFDALIAVPEDMDQFYQLYLQAVTFGLEALGQLSAHLTLPQRFPAPFDDLRGVWRFLVARSLALGGAPRRSGEAGPMAWLLDLP
ncbi:hypothetical protein L0F63_001699 [Massospora cicadina]|nr:hypothetical protein L0F63_001699 [Massospora cicadina]